MEKLRNPNRSFKLHEPKELGDRKHIEWVRSDLPRDAVPGTRNAENTFLRLFTVSSGRLVKAVYVSDSITGWVEVIRVRDERQIANR